MHNPEDKILVFHLKQDNPKAFEQLFLKYWKKLYNFCKKILRNNEESESLVQTIFMEIWEDRHRLDEEKSFSGYLFKIAKNRIYNIVRKRINEQVYRDYILQNHHHQESNMTRRSDSKFLVEIIEQIIDGLPARRKEIFLLSRNEGLTYKQIASTLNISENTVDTQIRNTLNFLREKLHEMLNDERGNMEG